MRFQQSVTVSLATLLLSQAVPAQDEPSGDLLAAAEAAYPAAGAPTLFGSGSISAAFAGEPKDPVWATATEARIFEAIAREREEGLVFRRADVECRYSTCAILLVHAANEGEGSISKLVDAIRDRLGFQGTNWSEKQIPVPVAGDAGSAVKMRFIMGHVEVVLRAPRDAVDNGATEVRGVAGAEREDAVRSAAANTGLGYSLFSWPGSRRAGWALAGEPQDPVWSQEMESGIRSRLEAEAGLAMSRVEVECRTTVCAIALFRTESADGAAQDDAVWRVGHALQHDLDFRSVSVIRSAGASLRSSDHEIVLYGARNAGPPRSFEVWAGQFLLTDNAEAQLAIAEEIVQLNHADTLSVFLPYLRHEHYGTRANAAYVMARLGDARGISSLAEIVHDDGNLFSTGAVVPVASTDDQRHAVELLALIRDPRALDLLWKLVAYPNGSPARGGRQFQGSRSEPPILRDAVEALDRHIDSDAIPFLIDRLQDAEPYSRVLALRYLEELRASEAEPFIEALLSDEAIPGRGPRWPVSESAGLALDVIRTDRP